MKLYLRVCSQQLNKDCWQYERFNEVAQITYESPSNSLQTEVKPDHHSRCMLGKAAFPCIIKGVVSGDKKKTISQPR